MTESEFFRKCWLTLKAISSSKLRKQMDDIEVIVEGITITPSPVKMSEETNGKEREKPIIPV